VNSLITDVPSVRVFGTLLFSSLPQQMQAILASQIGGSLESASHLADKICEVTTQPTTVSISPAAPDNTAGLLERIEELSRQVASLRVQQANSNSQSRVRHRSQSRGHRRSTPDNSLQPNGICWYHWQFGNEARKCTPPCSHQWTRDPRQQRDSHQQRNSHQQADSQQENSTSGH